MGGEYSGSNFDPVEEYRPRTEREIQEILANRSPRKELTEHEREAALLAGKFVLDIANAVIKRDHSPIRRVNYGHMQRFDLSGIVDSLANGVPTITEIRWGGPKYPVIHTEVFRFHADQIDHEHISSEDERLGYTVEADFFRMTKLASDLQSSMPAEDNSVIV